MEVKSSSGMLIDDARGEMAVRGNAAPQHAAPQPVDVTAVGEYASAPLEERGSWNPC
jgi:hypothetical protein